MFMVADCAVLPATAVAGLRCSCCYRLLKVNAGTPVAGLPVWCPQLL
jgi:hypothetical protein